ncbi:hypothetical protein QR680_007451 [Steinernema hermaphroditum]|uniref:CHK kinase-like domain-containing protein n=1 Tax=Steinernema hermaphroditum TaxID=289476 RepID=A0AA39M5E1_9BILA|nr:hypothetical protein QR680_007451 [Steinernema hermaphroditum]
MGCGSSSAVGDSSVATPPLKEKDLAARLSVVIEPPTDDISSFNSSTEPISVNHSDQLVKSDELQFMCGTDVPLEWLHQRLIEKFKVPDEPEPQWIAERLNSITYSDTDKATVIRVTLGWENAGKLPHTVVLKIPVKNSDETSSDYKTRWIYRMFKRECNTYEWLIKNKKIAVPRVFVIKKQGSDNCGSVLVMEDLGEKYSMANYKQGMRVEAVQDLLKILALIHAQSMKDSEWTTMIAGLSPLVYQEMSESIETTLDVLVDSKEIEPSQRDSLKPYISTDYLSNTVSDACKELGNENVLVHGSPLAVNVFMGANNKVGAITDWALSHPGCFAEDVAKAICWNLSPQDRHSHLTRLLENYHYNFTRYYGGTECKLTLENIKLSYQRFVPMATVCLLPHLAQCLDRPDADVALLRERAKALIEDTAVMFLSDDSNEETEDTQE